MPDEDCYNEKYRPQFHFTARTNWLNDPNGCLFHQGTYHLFFQHNPTGVEWGNMTWGHAESPDLVHWKQVENAIFPYDGGTIFSGSAVVDWHNDTMLGNGSTGPLIAAFTHARKPFGQAIAFSNNCGKSWDLYNNGKHVVPNQGLDEEERDPKILWHEPTRKWIMVLWVQKDQVRFFTSADLLQWDHTSDFMAEGFFECPDLFPLPVDRHKADVKWVLHDAALNYWIGSFDGKAFKAEDGPLAGDYGSNFYAAQTWNNTGSRVVQIGWMRGGNYPNMPFNQQMSFPCELSLRNTPRGIRLCRMPVEEIASLRMESAVVGNQSLEPGETLEIGSPGDLFDVEFKVAVSPNSSFHIRFCGQDVSWSAGRIECLGKEADLPETGGVVSLRILVDRTSIELFGNGGEVCMSLCFLSHGQNERVKIRAGNESLQIRTFTVSNLSSAWNRKSDKLTKNPPAQ